MRLSYIDQDDQFLLNGAMIAYHFFELKEDTLDRVESSLRKALDEVQRVRNGDIRKILSEKGYDLK